MSTITEINRTKLSEHYDLTFNSIVYDDQLKQYYYEIEYEGSVIAEGVSRDKDIAFKNLILNVEAEVKKMTTVLSLLAVNKNEIDCT